METTKQQEELNPSKIMQIGMGFMASKSLLAATNLELFTLLAQAPMSGTEIASKLGLHERSLYDFLEMLYEDPAKMREFIMAMGGIQMGNFAMFANAFDFSGYQTHCDVGGSGAHLSSQIALNNPHMNCTSFDLPVVNPVAKEILAGF